MTVEGPRVTTSVVMATHNGAAYVREQLLSILRQTHGVDEVIVGDDASEDGTVAVVEEMQKLFAARGIALTLRRHEPALGILANFEDALRCATGEVIFFSDQDDVWEAEKVQTVLDVFAAGPAVRAVFTDAREIDGAGAFVGRRLWQAAGLDHVSLAAWDRDALGQELRGNCVTGATLAIRRTCLDLVLPFPDIGYHDGWIALLLTAAGGADVIVALPAPLIRYRVHGGNASGGLVPLGRLAGLLWYVERGRAAEDVDVSQLPAAVERLEAHDLDSVRVKRKANFMARRRSLPGTIVRRAAHVTSHEMRSGYSDFASGRLPALLDIVWYDAEGGSIRPLPRVVKRLRRP